MIKTPSLKIILFSLFGLVISGISLTSGVWVIRPIGRSLTAIDLWISLSTAFKSTELLAGSDRQQAIFIWLSLIIAAFILQVITTVLIFTWRKMAGWVISVILWILILLATVVLMAGYNAVVSGVMWLAFGSALALAGELWVIFGEVPFQQRDHAREMSKVEKRWSNTFDEAREQEQSFSILAVHASPPISPEEYQTLQTELRGRDLIYPVQNGMFVLLWQITAENTSLIAGKILNILEGNSTREVQIGSASFPTDGDDFLSLLAHAAQALQSAQQVGGSVVIPFSAPAAKGARGILAPWEGLLAEAAITQMPVSLLFFKTSHPISLVENHIIQKELRGRDLVAVFENGVYVFLWNTTLEGGQIVLTKLDQILAVAKIENQPVMAHFPEDGKNLAELLAALEREFI